MRQLKIRFKKYNDVWENVKLTEAAPIVMGQSPDSKNYTDNPNDYILVQGNADMQNGRVVPRVWTTQITKLAEKGDLILSVRAPVGDIGKTDYNVVLGRGVAAIKGNEFIFQLLSRMKQFNYWSKLSTGSTFESINSSDIKSTEIYLPSQDEQSAIGSLFRILDDLLASYKDNLANYQSLKATMLSKMFPKAGQTVPEIRLDGFEDDWELIKLGEVCDLITKGTTAKSQSEQGKVNFVKVENLKENEIYPVVKISEEEHLGSLKRSILYEGDILFSIAGTLGRTAIVRNNMLPANTNQALAIIRGYKLDAYFLLVVLSGEVVKDYIRKNPTVGAQPNLSLEQVSSLKIQVPSIEEQQAIGAYFSNLDNLISSHQEKISQLEILKKKLLQDMFI